MKPILTFVRQNIRWLLAAFFALALGLVGKTFLDYGVTWDEGYHQFYGDFILKWYLSFFNDASAIRHPFLIYYGGFFDTLAHAAACLSPWGALETRHLLTALFGLWTVFMGFKIAEHIADRLAGFCASLFLLLHPVFYGHMFNNPVDVPFAALTMTTLYSMITTYDRLPELSLKDLFKIGLPLGLAMAVRISGVFILLPCLAIFWFLWLISRKTQDPAWAGTSLRPTLILFIRNFFGVLAIAWVVMLVWWPWAQLNPLIHPLTAALKAIRWDLNPKDMTVFFDGTYYGFFKAPRSYLIRWILITLPEFFWGILLIGCVVGILGLHKDPKPTKKRTSLGLLIFAAIFPVSSAMIFRTPQFDGFRHYLFLIPLLATLGGISFAAFLRTSAARWIKIALSLPIVFSLSLTAWDMYRLHPYQTVYFNRLAANGLAEASKHYETDYWGNAYREGILWVIKNYHPDLQRKIRVMNASEPFQIAYYLEKTPELRTRFETVKTDPDIFLATTRWDRHRSFPGKTLYTVERDHTPLLYVIEVSKEPS
jgi:Dolichyl-phosphate-mannose-protein mannosyltransferase